jgi:hypothetical protein
VEISGKAGPVSGSCPALVFEVKTRTVYTTSATQFRDGGCRNLRKGSEVEVRGVEMSDHRVRADRVTFRNDIAP